MSGMKVACHMRLNPENTNLERFHSFNFNISNLPFKLRREPYNIEGYSEAETD
jgi:hypothetical protein